MNSNPKKSTNIELVQILEGLNTEGRYNDLITKAKAYHFHDFKCPLEDVAGPKVYLYDHLAKFPELKFLAIKVVNGEFDEEADEEDKKSLQILLPKSLWDKFGLK